MFNRIDNCCDDRLNGATVYVGNVNSNSPADYTAVGTLGGGTTVQSLTGVNTTGRYVMVRIAGQGTLSLAEVQVFGEPQTGGGGTGGDDSQPTDNLALNQPATQSSTDYSGAAGLAVDGNTNGVYGNGSVTHTQENSQNPWWRVDLGATYNVEQINVFNRIDNCCDDRLNGATVYVGNVNSNSPADYTAVGTLSGSTSVQSLTGVNTTGRYVMVRIAGQGTLSLAEVQVFGEPQAAGTFVPDPNKIYHIDNPAHGLRLAALENSEILESTSLTSNGDNTQWKFVQSATAGLWHIQRAAGGSTPRIRTVLTTTPDMQATSSSGDWTRFSITPNSNRPGTYLLTVPLANTESQRLRLLATGETDFATNNNTGDNPSFVFTEVEQETAFVPDPNKIYHIDNPAHGLRLAALANSEVLESRTFASAGVNTQWQFVQSATAGLWHIQRAAGGSTPRIRTVLTTTPDMQATSSSGDWTRFSVTPNPNRPGTWLLTVPLANTENQRLRLLADGTTDFDTVENTGNNPSFVFTEVN